jgi:hypothetical protein
VVDDMSTDTSTDLDGVDADLDTSLDSEPGHGGNDDDPHPDTGDGLAADDAQAYQQALEVAGPADITYDQEGNAVLTRDPYDILAEHDAARGVGPAHRPDREPPAGREGLKRPDERTPTVLPEASHGKGNGPGVGGGKAGKPKWWQGTPRTPGGGGGGLHIFTVDLSGWFRGWLSPDVEAGNGNGLVTTSGRKGKR